jgi:hypothetical protein
MLKNLAIVVGAEWFVALVGMSLAGTSISLAPAVVLLVVIAAGTVAAVKVVDSGV